jgi:hypothetical protein
MQKLTKNYVCPVVYEIKDRLPGPICRIIGDYVISSPLRYNVNRTTIEIYDLEEVLRLCCRGNKCKGHQPKKIWTWSLMRQLLWIVSRLNWRCVCHRDKCHRDKCHWMYTGECCCDYQTHIICLCNDGWTRGVCGRHLSEYKSKISKYIVVFTRHL